MIVHIYSQTDPHGEAVILGDREGLIVLRDMLNKAIDGNEPAYVTEKPLFCRDGEGYHCFAIKNTDFEQYSFPYTSEPYTNLSGAYPLSFISGQKLRELLGL